MGISKQVELNRPDGGGSFKFIVISLKSGATYVRGDKKAEIHYQILRMFATEMGVKSDGYGRLYDDDKLVGRCVGGGRMEFRDEEKSIQIWGKSDDFGQYPENIAQVLQVEFPEWKIVDRGL